jgi:hypothetical protein
MGTGGHTSTERRRLVAFFLLSTLVHAGAAGAVVASSILWRPQLDITWLNADNILGAPPLADPALPAPPSKGPPPAPRPTPRPPRVRAHPARPAPGEEVAMVLRRDAGPADAGGPATRDGGPAPPRPGRFTAAQASLGEYAPGDAALMLLLRMDRVRGSPYERSVRRLLEVFYDHKTILWSSGIDPIRDFETLLIATPNPYRVTQTFLAAQYTGGQPRMKRALEHAARFKDRRLRWTRSGAGLRGEIPSPPKLAHDPRVVFVRPRLMMLTDPKHIPLFATPASSPAADAGVPAPSWMERLSLMNAKGGTGAESPGMMLQALNLQRLVVLPADLPTPSSLQVTVTAREPAIVEGVLLFSSVQLARGFLVAMPQRIARAKRSLLLRFLGVTEMLDNISFKRKESVVWATAKLTGDQVRALLEVIRGVIPQVRVPGMPDRQPRDAGPQPDAPRRGPTDARAPDSARDHRDGGPDLR